MEQYQDLPKEFTPELLRALNVRELLIVVANYGACNVAERIGYDEFVAFIRFQSAAIQQNAQDQVCG